MAVAVMMDAHIPRAITDQLRRRGVDVLTAAEDGSNNLPDEDLLEPAQVLGRLLFTQDIRFRVMAEDWQRQGRPFAGLVYGRQMGGTIGQYVASLELIARASEPADWHGVINYIPY